MSEPTSGPRRVRTRRACVPCSSRKRKCNGAYPCDACTGYGYICRYRNYDRRPRRTPSPAGQSLVDTMLDTPSTSAPKYSSPMRVNAINDQQVQSERVYESNNGFLAVQSSRYVGRHSSDAFPRFLGLQLHSQELPELQSFAWNLEVRDIPPCTTKSAICSLISLDEARRQVKSFFLSDFPACGFLDLQALNERCERHWASHDQGLPFEALIGGIIGLASILMPMRSLQQEADIIKHVQNILADSTVAANPSVEILAATVLQTLYLRATATTHVTWLSSCTAMHMAEALGLHKDYDSTVRGDGDSNSLGDFWGPQARSFLFWIVCAGNRISSHDLGRSPVVLHGVTRKFPFSLSDRSGAATLCRLACSLPLKEIRSESEERTKLAELLATIEKTSTDQPFLRLITADVCFSLYRRIRVNAYSITKSQSQQIVLIGRAAIKSANELLKQGPPWWNMLTTLFQFTCVLISMDSLDSLVDVQDALETINLVQTRYPGRRAAQALSTLKLLIRASRQKKEREIACLQAFEPGPEVGGVMTDAPFEVPDDTFPHDLHFDFSNWGVDDLDWIFEGAPFGRGQPLQPAFVQ